MNIFKIAGFYHQERKDCCAQVGLLTVEYKDE